jgi:hypothetical protein
MSTHTHARTVDNPIAKARKVNGIPGRIHARPSVESWVFTMWLSSVLASFAFGGIVLPKITPIEHASVLLSYSAGGQVCSEVHDLLLSRRKGQCVGGGRAERWWWWWWW